jgi:hypothetical protein
MVESRDPNGRGRENWEELCGSDETEKEMKGPKVIKMIIYLGQHPGGHQQQFWP